MIIGVTSLARAGKDTFADYLVDNYGFVKLNLSDVLREELMVQGKPATKEEMSKLGDEWRTRYGMHIVMRRTLDKAQKFDRAIITGLRSMAEISLMRNNSDKVYVVAITASRDVRYERRNRLDPQTKEEFFARDERDINNKGLDEVIKSADYEIRNNYSNKQDFYDSIDKLMRLDLH